MNSRIRISNGHILIPGTNIPGGTLLIDDGRIIAAARGNVDFPDAFEIDARGRYVAPGFIDIHVHGGGGFDFMDNTHTAFLKIAELHAQYGTTSMLPTTLTSSREELLKTLTTYREAVRLNVFGSQFLGIHLEGPYFAPNQRGAQDIRYIRDPDPGEYKSLITAFPEIRRWSIAPERKGSLELGRYLSAKGILAAVAHSDAVYEEVEKAFENGFSLITHLYSGMSGVTRKNGFRYAGVIESAFIIDEMAVEIIADGIHLPPPLLKLVYKIKGPGKIALITDAMRGAGMPEGESILGNREKGLKVIIEDGVAKLPDRSAFAGSVATASRLVKTMISQAGVSLSEAVEMAASTPASILGIGDRKGSLEEGKDADVIIFDENITIETTIINGHVVFSR